uniref:Ribonuclease II-like barrel domain-containing protein n=1 Tax=Musa acuminata subsp. malaccensis TaxID=214687 RepID=A0A804HN67_MUSAM
MSCKWDYQAVRSYLMLNWRRKLAGLLLEFRKDSQKTLPPVVQKLDGKKNWMVCDPVPINNFCC